MTIILDAVFDRTLDQIVTRTDVPPGETLNVWTFDDRQSRRKAERRLAQQGVTARFRSAYKPLLHFILEEVTLDGLVAVEVAYPVHPAAADNRFLLEAYPLAALLDPAHVTFSASPVSSIETVYGLTLSYSDGRKDRHSVFAPNHLHGDMIGEPAVSPTGWIAIGDDTLGERLETDYEQLFWSVLDALERYDWPSREPFFEELDVQALFPAQDEPLGFGHETLSLAEALHEDFYFSILELFKKRSGRPAASRDLKPGRIVPQVSQDGDRVCVRVTLQSITPYGVASADQDLSTARSPLDSEQVLRELAKIQGAPFAVRSVAGRRVEARHRAGTDAPVMISGGQHPNEITGVAGALRGALELAKRPTAHFTIAPLENPDGYGLHQHLCVENPHHMHHAARYTSAGDDFEYRTGSPLFEKDIRHQALALSNARLHINLHGYPAHEWTRPLSGYIPRGFAMWTLPKGFFLILRHQPGWAATARTLLDGVTQRLASVPGLIDFNAAQIELYRTHAGSADFEVLNGFPAMVSEFSPLLTPVMLITEHPDETIYGDDFILGHTAQMAAVVAAYDVWQEIVADRTPAV